MVVELSAVRLLAPWYGMSNSVWTHAIGVILLALALGYALGARLSRRQDPLGPMVWVLAGASLWCALLPLLCQRVAPWFMPSGVTLHGAGGLLFWGSLASSLLLFLVPALLLGCVAPLAVEQLSKLQVRLGQHAGQAGGRVLALSTLGSLVGTFATTYYLVPSLGLRWTFALAGGLLALAGGLLAWERARGKALAGMLGLWGVAGLIPFPVASPGVGERWLAQVESPYQWIRVVEVGEGATLERRMVVNEAFDSYQSLWRPSPGLLGPGSYYDYFASPAHWDPKPGPWRVLVLGLGAGTAVRVLEGALPEGMQLESTGVEIDPDVVRLGQEFFDLERNDTDRRVFAGQDARQVLRRLPNDFDQIILDAYANNVEIPPHLCTLEFFREVRGHLRDGGWVTANLSGFGLEDPVIQAVSRTLASAMEAPVWVAQLPFSRNAMVYARRGGELPDPSQAGFADVENRELVARLQGIRLPGTSRTLAPDDAAVLTDDACPILTLERASIERGALGWLQQVAP